MSELPSLQARAVASRDQGVPPTHLAPVGRRLPWHAYLKELWRRRDFIVTLAVGSLRAQNQATVLGQLWHLMNPLLLVGVFFLIFGVLLKDVSRGVDNYLAFLVVGIITFTYTQKTLQSAARVFIVHQRLVQTINFPRGALPASAVLSETLAHLPALAVMIALVIATGEPLHPAWVLVVPATVLQAAFNLGAGMVVTRLTFHFRDVQQLLPYVFRLWFYVSGIIFSLDRIPGEHVRAILRANPMAAFVTIFHRLVLEGRVDAGAWGVAAAWTAATLVVGAVFFRRAEQEYGRV